MKHSKFFGLLFITTLLVLPFVARADATWDEPKGPPPTKNAEAPLNVSSAPQVKSGSLGIGGLLRAWSQILIGGQATDKPTATLDVRGDATVLDNISTGGSNSWVFHTPDDGGRTALFFAPKVGGAWDWAHAVTFENSGKVDATDFCIPATGKCLSGSGTGTGTGTTGTGTAVGDNLGNHTADQDLNMNDKQAYGAYDYCLSNNRGCLESALRRIAELEAKLNTGSAGVSRIIAGNNVSISPESGVGVVTINASAVSGKSGPTVASRTDTFTQNVNAVTPGQIINFGKSCADMGGSYPNFVGGSGQCGGGTTLNSYRYGDSWQISCRFGCDTVDLTNHCYPNTYVSVTLTCSQ